MIGGGCDPSNMIRCREIDALVLTLLTTGDSQKPEAKLIHQRGSKDVRFPQRCVVRCGGQVIPETRNQDLIQLAASKRLKSIEVCAIVASKEIILGGERLIEAHRTLTVVVLEGRRGEIILALP